MQKLQCPPTEEYSILQTRIGSLSYLAKIDGIPKLNPEISHVIGSDVTSLNIMNVPLELEILR